MKSVTGGGLAAGTWKKVIAAAKQDSSPSKYKLDRSFDIRDEFGDLLGRILSEGRPSLDNEAKTSQIGGLEMRPTFTPDHSGDRVGYGRLND